MTILVIISQLVSTLILFGIIWIIQLVHYPSFSGIRAEKFHEYHASHTFWITPVVAPAMVIELITSILLIYYRPPAFDQILVYCGLLMTFMIWASTIFVQIPLHNELARGLNPQVIANLVRTNWIRTVFWSLRSVLMIYFLWRLIRI